MGINVGMLLFGLFDGALAFTIVFCLIRAWMKGKKIGRVLGTIFGILVFSAYIALFVWFNTPGTRVNIDFRNIIYAAPIVLSILLVTLVLLSQPPKPKTPDEDSLPEAEEQSVTEEKL